MHFQHHVAIGAQGRHPVLVPYAHRGQRAGEAPAPVGHLLVGEGSLPVDDGDPVGEDRGRAVEEGYGRQRGERELCHPAALSRTRLVMRPGQLERDGSPVSLRTAGPAARAEKPRLSDPVRNITGAFRVRQQVRPRSCTGSPPHDRTRQHPGERARPGGNNVKPFVVNRHGRLVFPANFLGELDFSVLESLDQFTAVIGRDFEAKAPTGTDILSRVESGSYTRRFELLRDLGQHLYWANRYSITMFDRRPTRWRDLAKRRDDVYLPVLTPWEDSERKVAAVEQAFRALPATWDARAEDTIFGLLFDLFRTKLYHATELPPIKPTVAEFRHQPDALTFVMPTFDPDYPVFTSEQILDANEDVPELEALMRWAMVLHNQYPWDRSRTELRGPGQIGDDDFVVAFHPRNRDVQAFIERVKRPGLATAPDIAAQSRAEAVEPVTLYPPVRVREAFTVQPRFEALAIARGEHVC